MSLALIVGPPNAGRAGAIRRRFIAALERDPVLVVPTRDDADRFERELAEGEGAIVGGSVRTFPLLFEDVARADGPEQPQRLSDAQRLWLVRAAVAGTELRILRSSAASAGFAPAMDDLLAELQASGLDSATLLARAAEADSDGAYEAELAQVFAAYERLRDGLGRSDAHTLAAAATAALRTRPEAWGRRPVLLYGFDDLTGEQLELVHALAAATEVTVAVTFQQGREALAARAGLLELLRERGGRVTAELRPERAYTASSTLFHLERHLFERPQRIERPDGGLVLLSAAGELAEAEQIGGEIARLLASGVAPDEVAVVARSLERHGPLLEQVLGKLGIPVSVDARVPFAGTATGRALLAALRAAGDAGTADDVLAVLRAPGRTGPGGVDWLERSLRRARRRSAADALEAWRERSGWEPFEIEQLRGAADADIAALAGRIAVRIAQRPYERSAPRPGRAAALELRAAAAACAALSEIAELGGPPSSHGDVAAILEGLGVPLWRGPAEGTVRVLSPYGVRARRVRHLFVASLQEGEFPSYDSGDPLLTDERRADLGLPARRDPRDEERYLFYACVSRASERLYLSWRDSDDDGQALAPSPFLDDVRDVLPADGIAVRRRGLDAVTFAPRDAPSADELARSLAELGRGRAPADLLGELGVPAEVAEPVAARLADVASRLDGPPGPLREPAVLGALEDRELYGASTLEGYALCSYRWFVDHELDPQSLEPDPEPLAQGAILHKVLERLYREPPTPEGIPRPGSLAAWTARAHELLEVVAAERGAPRDALGRVGLRRMAVLLERHLAREAEAETPMRPDRELIEASFGDGEHDRKPALELAGFRLHGKIDRVDVAPGGAGLIRDYKLGKSVPRAAELEAKGRLQLQLYMTALREQWQIEPIGGVYVPLSATDSPKPRGLLLDDERGELLDAHGFVSRDFLDPEEFEAALTAARTRAAEIVAGMRAGAIDRNPIDDSCPPYCRFQPICRRERAVAPEPERADEEPAE